MFLFIILTIILLILVTLAVLAISAGGAAFVIIFGDVIVCVLLIAWIMKRLIGKKR